MGNTANIALDLFKQGQKPLEAFINANKQTGYRNSWNFIDRDLSHKRGVNLEKYLENVNKYYNGQVSGFQNFLDIIHKS